MYYDNNGSFFTKCNKDHIIAYKSISYQNKKSSTLVFRGRIKSVQEQKTKITGRFYLPKIVGMFVYVPVVVVLIISTFSDTNSISLLIMASILLCLWIGMSLLIKNFFLQITKVRNMELIKLLQIDDKHDSL